MYRSLRKAAVEKASAVSGPNSKILKPHYLSQAARYTEKMREVEKLTSKEVIKSQNNNRDVNVLDLHMLTVPASLSACENFLEERLRALKASVKAGGPNKMTLSFITGWGKHSTHGKGRIKPAVRGFLAKKGFKPKEVDNNPGIMIITIT